MTRATERTAGAPPESLEGVLERIAFHENGFFIGVLASGDRVKGSMLAPERGIHYRFAGRWESHPKYGPAFKFESYESVEPTDEPGIVKYLAENCDGIGPAIARRIWKRYGSESLQALKEDPAAVAREIQGITERTAEAAADVLRRREAYEQIEVSLINLVDGLPIAKATIRRIIEAYDTEALEVVRTTPYRLIDDIWGIGFERADLIAARCGIIGEEPERLQAGIVHYLKEAATEGHCYFPWENLVRLCRIKLEVSGEAVEQELLKMASADNPRVVVDGERVYLTGLYRDEQTVAERIQALLARPVDTPPEPDLEGLAADQREAMGKVLESAVFILTGAPGTGKTYTIKRILSTLRGQQVILCAPTGKAAKRITEQTGAPAATIHRTLGLLGGDESHGPKHHRGNPLQCRAVVVDETSMVDVSLMAKLVDAVPVGARLILVGDTYQLPSVGPGSVLRDLIEAGVPSTELTEIKRQDPGLIVRNCHQVKDGRPVLIDNAAAGDFFFREATEPEEIERVVLGLVCDRLPRAYGLDPMADIQVISPRRQGASLACNALNSLLQERLNKMPEVQGTPFRLGDRVIQTRNDYDHAIMNGDLGRVARFDLADARKPSVVVEFQDPAREVTLPLRENNLELAYALTVHKMQGSEAPAIVIPIHRCLGGLMLQRNLIYTAISRAQRLCVIVGSKHDLGKAVRRNRQDKRFTWLRERLEEGTP